MEGEQMAWIKVDDDGDVNWRPHFATTTKIIRGVEIEDFPCLVWLPIGIYGSHIRQIY
jgi:hypothetical protein